jgi:hypothetical protein
MGERRDGPAFILPAFVPDAVRGPGMMRRDAAF